MSVKFAVSLICSLAASLVVVATASAQTQYTKTVGAVVEYDVVDFCLAADDQLSYRLRFTASVTGEGKKPPSKIRVMYQVVDTTSKWTLTSRVINLKKSHGYTRDTRRIVATAGHKLAYRVKMSFRAFGRTWRDSKVYPDEVPSVLELRGLGLPSC